MAQSDGAVETLTAEQVGHGCSDDIRAAEDDTVLASGLNTIAFEQCADAHGGGGEETLLAEDHAADVDGGKAVDILVGRDGVDNLLLVDMLGQGQLHDEAVDVGVVVEERYRLQQLCLGGLLAHAVDTGGEAHLVGGFLLVGDIGHTGPVLAYNYSGQMGSTVTLLGQRTHLIGYLVLDLQGQRLAVQ